MKLPDLGTMYSIVYFTVLHILLSSATVSRGKTYIILYSRPVFKKYSYPYFSGSYSFVAANAMILPQPSSYSFQSLMQPSEFRFSAFDIKKPYRSCSIWTPVQVGPTRENFLNPLFKNRPLEATLQSRMFNLLTPEKKNKLNYRLGSDFAPSFYGASFFQVGSAEIARQAIPDGVASSDAMNHGGLMSPIKHHIQNSIAGAYKPPFDSVVNLPSMYAGQNVGGRTEFTNPSSDPHLFGIPFTPNGDHNTWPGPVVGFEPRLPSIVHADPMRTVDYGTSSNPPDELGYLRPMTSSSISYTTTSKTNSNGVPLPRFKSQQIKLVPGLVKPIYSRHLHTNRYNTPLLNNNIPVHKAVEGGFAEGRISTPLVYRFLESSHRNQQAMSAAVRAEAFQLAEAESGLYMGNGVRAPPGAFRMIQTPYGRRLGFSSGHTLHRFAKFRKRISTSADVRRFLPSAPVFPPTSPPPPGKSLRRFFLSK
jgi:hypothetical protein